MNADMQTNPAPNRREVLDCGSPLPLSDRGAQPPTFSRATTVPRPPKAPEDWRTPRRWRATSLAHPMGEGRGEGVPTFPIRAIREIRGQFLLALLLGALLLAGGAGGRPR